MTVTEPPAAESGEKYGTVDERCAACVMKGGPESKCVSKQWEEMIGRPQGKECPRVELWPSLTPDAEIMEFALSERLRPALAVRAELVAVEYGMTEEQLNAALSRVSSALSHPDISSILNPKVEG